MALPESTSFRFSIKRLGELFAPGLLQLLHLGQRALDLIGVGQRLALFQFLVQGAQAFVHAVDFAGVAAEQVVAQVEPVLHHLEADGIGRVGQFQRLLRGLLGVVLALHRSPVHQEQHQHHRQDDAEIQYKLFADRHALSPPRPGAATAAQT